MQHDETRVPNIRRKPERVSQEQWERFVEGLFPKCTNVTHRVVLRGDRRGDSHCTCAVFRFGVYGTCSHILFARSQYEHVSPDRSYSEMFVRHGLRHEIVFRPSPEAPRLILKAAKHCFDSDDVLIFDHFPYLKTLIDRAADCRHELLIDDEVFEHIAFQLQQKERHRRIIAAFRRGANSKAFDSLLLAPLATWQREAALNAAIAGRFLLFDSPGLGRRRTAIAAAEILAQTTGIRRVLILTNTPTLHTWSAELRQSSTRTSQVVWGSPARRSESYAADVQYMVARYDDLPTDINVIIGRMRPDLIVLDETHTLKRHGAETARIVRRLESEHLFVLSGADPVRVPGPFVSFVDMIDRHRVGLLDAFLTRHQRFDLQKNSVTYVDMGRVANTLPHHFRRFESAEYRRSLPDLIEHDRFLPITESQAKHHADLQNRLFHLAEQAGGRRREAGDKGQGAGIREQGTEVSEEPQTATLTPNPCPLTPPLTLHKMQAFIAEMLRTANDMSLVAPARERDGQCIGASGHKLDVMLELLQEYLESTHVKAIVFAHESRFLKAAQSMLAGSPVEYGMIDRYTPISDQKTAGERFFREPNFRVLFVGDGVSERLVLRNVQLVIHLDVPWDADRMRQRHARVSMHPTYRPCHAYRLISHGTVEHWLAKLQGDHELFSDTDLRDGRSVVLLDETGRVKFFEHVNALLEQVKEPPMVD